MPSAKADDDPGGNQHHAGQGPPCGHDEQPEARRRRACKPKAAGAGQASVPLAPGVVHLASGLSGRPEPDHPPIVPPPTDTISTERTGSNALSTFQRMQPCDRSAYIAAALSPLFAGESSVIFGPAKRQFGPHTAIFGAN